MAVTAEKLEKIYKVKNGADVRALKGISFNLPDTGMVFILGKSGCGKSTLLNVLGGLDGFDGGDIIIDGKPLKGYKAKDFDRYRYDYVGFVFQENNLLEKETVNRNISLALELQGDKDKDGKVEAVLESVGLKGFAGRSCNRLSGGQKQRTAIARALIKSPKLLLCDEPTGALDSETGEEIFSLLKELSAERLVVVVSHDRESAEKYGDRVIELKDGEIISDSAPQNATPTTEKTDDKKKHGGLNILRAFTLGAGYILACPIRMAICLLLCLITFTCVGVADTVNAYDGDKVLLKTMQEADSRVYVFGKAEINSSGGFYLEAPDMTAKEAEELKSLLSVKRSDSVYKLDMNTPYLIEVEGTGSENLTLMMYASAFGFAETDGSFFEDYGFPLLAGRLPENNSEVALPRYLADFFLSYGYHSESGTVKINSYNDMLGKTVTMNRSGLPPLTVTGIADTHCALSDKERDVLYRGAPRYNDFISDMYVYDGDVVYKTLFVCKGFSDYFTERYVDDIDDEIVLRVIAPFTGKKSEKLKNFRIYDTQYGGKPVDKKPDSFDGGDCYHMVNYYAKKISEAEEEFYYIQNYSIYAVLGMVVISALFIMYYASGTIEEKRREIGILRALGASRMDIVKITACEHGSFTAVAVAVSSIISLIVGIVMNSGLVKSNGLSAVFIRFGIRQFAVMLAVATLAVVAGIAIPLVKLLKAKPVDVIADRK